MRREAHTDNRQAVVRDLRPMADHPPKGLPGVDPVDEEARRELLRAQGAFLKAQEEGRIPSDARFQNDEVSRAMAPATPAETGHPSDYPSPKDDLEPVVEFYIMGWGIAFLLPTSFLDFFRRPLWRWGR